MSTYFIAFGNRFKGKGQPDFLGETQDGTKKIALWAKKDRKGRLYYSIKVEDVELPEGLTTEEPKKAEPTAEKTPPPVPGSGEDDDLFPF